MGLILEYEIRDLATTKGLILWEETKTVNTVYEIGCYGGLFSVEDGRCGKGTALEMVPINCDTETGRLFIILDYIVSSACHSK